MKWISLKKLCHGKLELALRFWLDEIIYKGRIIFVILGLLLYYSLLYMFLNFKQFKGIF